MDDFDYSKQYYRPVDRGNGYASDDDDIINDAEGYIEADYEMIEFSSLLDVGRWIHLGKEIKVLSIPEDANVVKNMPMSQGGCYEYSTNKAIVAETIDVFEYLRRVKNESIRTLSLENLEFPPAFEFPETVIDIGFVACTFKSNPNFTKNLRELCLHKCSISGKFDLPKSLDYLSISETIDTFNSDVDFIFPQVIKDRLHLDFIVIKRPFDMSAYICNYICFEFCDFIEQLVLPEIQYYEQYVTTNDHKRELVNVPEGCIEFKNCFETDSIIIPKDFAGTRTFRFENTPISPKLVEGFKHAKDCVFKEISLKDLTFVGDFFLGINVKNVFINRCKIEGALLLPEKLDNLIIICGTKKHENELKVKFPVVVEETFLLISLNVDNELDLSKYTCSGIKFRSCNFLKPFILPEKQIYTHDYRTDGCSIKFENCTGMENIIVPGEFVGNTKFVFRNTEIDEKKIRLLENKYNCRVDISN